MLDCKILTSDAQVEALAGEWRALHARMEGSLHTDYDWFYIWRHTIGNVSGRMLHIITGRRNQELVALLPLVVTPKKGFRILQPIGAEAFYPCDILCEDTASAEALWHTARQSPHYDFGHFLHVSPGSANQKVLSSFASMFDKSKSFSLHLRWRMAEEWKATLSANMRKNIHKAERQLAQQGTVRYELYRSAPLPDGMLEAIVEHKIERCKKNRLTGMFDQPNILQYLQHIVQEEARRNTLVVMWLKCGDAIIAYDLMLVRKKTLVGFMATIDPAWHKYSPGTLLHVHAIAWAIENGFEVFDLMQGEADYKYKLSNQVQEFSEYTFHTSLRGWIGEMLFTRRRLIREYIHDRLSGDLKKYKAALQSFLKACAGRKTVPSS
jgi:CelD/BcsL family acetyltransferase involved in cellulose biosynthesis